MNSFDKTTGIILRSARKSLGMKQLDAAKKIGKSRIWLSDVENGKISIYWSDLKKLVILYGLDWEVFDDI